MPVTVIYGGAAYVITQHDTTTLRNKLAQAVKSGTVEWVPATTADELKQSVALAFGPGIPVAIVG